MKTISKNCMWCKKPFDLKLKEYNRCIKTGRPEDKFFCSLSCNASHINTHLTEDQAQKRLERLQSAKKYCPQSIHAFGKYIQRAKQRCKTLDIHRHREVNVTAEDLAEIWDNQKGRCALSNVPMKISTWRGRADLLTASMDRRDNSLGYTKENVQFVCLAMNFAKNSRTDAEILEVIAQIRKAI